MICGFSKRQDVPSESTFSRAFGEFVAAGLGALVHDALIEEYLRSELIGGASLQNKQVITGAPQFGHPGFLQKFTWILPTSCGTSGGPSQFVETDIRKTP